ncbi:MAG: DUF3536 domain-containing protein [Desulfurococcaceae archaeon TW002]
MSKYVVIHAHFYQPSREDPWLFEVPNEESAYPYHDWNERITEECYRPNASIPIVDRESYVVDVINNYSWISFNVGPTLLRWLEEKAHDVYEAIIEADRVSRSRFSGHGSAIAQVYNHLIMPLANREDKYVVTYWGIEVFKEAFGRLPEGMWLPETAVDDESLDVLAELGIKFTVLAPHQARAVRGPEGVWVDVSGGRIDTRRPYIYKTSSGRSIVLFFYDARLSHSVAFGDLLSNGDVFAKNILKAFSSTDETELVTVATDGETYGHHKKYGHLALAYALRTIDEMGLAKITNFGKFLELNPPKWEVKIAEKTSWSCAHGVERWRSNCGCRIDINRAWNQEWRKPLRDAMDWLISEVKKVFIDEASEIFTNPMTALLNYVSVVGKSEEVINEYLGRFTKAPLTKEVRSKALELMEMMRHAYLMFSSDGWFFDDISNIESIQVMKHAARAIQLTRKLSNVDLETDFLRFLKNAKSNVPDLRNGANIYDLYVRSSITDFHDVCVMYSMLSLSPNHSGDTRRIFSYVIEDLGSESYVSGSFRSSLGKARVTYLATLESFECVYYSYSINKHILAGASAPAEKLDLRTLRDVLRRYIDAGEFSELEKFLKEHFNRFRSFSDLRRDLQLAIVNDYFSNLLDRVHERVKEIFSTNYSIVRSAILSKTPFLDYFKEFVKLYVTYELRELLSRQSLNSSNLRDILTVIKEFGVELPDLISVLDTRVSNQLYLLTKDLSNLDVLDEVMRCVLVLKDFVGPATLKDFWKTRAAVCLLRKKYRGSFKEGIEKKDVEASKALPILDELSRILNIKC